MSSAGSIPTRRVCGCLGCAADADLIVRHPTHGRRVVCGDHAGDYPVVDDVTGGVPL